MPQIPPRPRSTLLAIVLLWLAFYASVALFTPPLLDDADSVHAEVAREMLLRHDYVTLYANGIRYLEKAPLFYWSMAASMKLAMLFGATTPRALAAAARLPLALAMLALALLCEALARRMFGNTRAGLNAALITLSSFGMFLFTRMLIPDAAVCLWITLALYALWRTEALEPPQTPVISTEGTAQRRRSGEIPTSWHHHRLFCYLFALACALNVLTKGLIGIVFPVGIALLYYLLTRGVRGTLTRIRQLHPLTSIALFLLVAAPWHVFAGLANPGHGHPAAFHFVRGHWQVPLPTDGNVRGWFWFYFMNEHLLRYLSLRVPHDYDTAPLWLFWGLCLLWLMPWSAFVFHAVADAVPLRSPEFRARLRAHTLPPQRRALLLLTAWAAFVLLFFALSSRQEYYVLPALPALAILIAAWLSQPLPLTQEVSSRPEPAPSPNTLSSRPESAPSPNTLSSRPESAFSPNTLSSRPESAPSPNTLSSRPESALLADGAERPPHSAMPDSPPCNRAAVHCLCVPLAFGVLIFLASLWFLLHTPAPSPNTDLAGLLTQNPADYALSLGHFMDLTGPAVALFRAPLLIAASALFLGPLSALILRTKSKPHAANLALAAGAFGFLIAVLWGLAIFSPVLTSAQLAQAIAPQVRPQDLVCIHGEYESGSTLAFYLQRSDIHILEGRSSNLWYGSFFPDAPAIFETPQSLAAQWPGPRRIFLWQSLTDPPNQLPPLPAPVYILVKSGGKEIVSNQPNR